MEPVLQSLIIKCFRSIRAETIEFDNPTFLVGRNGSGKSNFRDAIDFLAEVMSSPLQSVFKRRGGISAVRNRTTGGAGYRPPNIGLGAIMGPLNGQILKARYAFDVRATANNGCEVSREQCVVHLQRGKTVWFDRRPDSFRSNLDGLNPSLVPTALGLPLIGGDSNFAPVLRTLSAMRSYSIQPAKLREPQDVNGGAGLKADGSNTVNVLEDIRREFPDDYVRIGELLAAVVPNTKQVPPIKLGNKLSLQFTQEWGQRSRLKFEAANMSDGTLRALGLITAVYQHPPPTVLVIEEPEATIHPGALGAMLDLIRHASRNMQVIVTTHSPDVLDADWLADENLRIANWQEGATRILPLATGTRAALREHLMSAGELLRSNALRAVRVLPDASPKTPLFSRM